MSADIEADVVIVGSGVSGALMAAKLAEAGVKVAILEAGAEVDRADAVDRYMNALIKVPESAYEPTPEAPFPMSHLPDGWYRQTGPDKFGSTYLKVAGGTTWHWLGTCLRLLPADFELQSRYGHGVDWPISYKELEPFYTAADQELAVSGLSSDDLGAPRSGDFPMGPISPSYLDRTLGKALDGSGMTVRSTPQARNSVDHEDRPACCGNSSCIPCCPIQAKYDATVHLERAKAAGATLYTRSTAVRLTTDHHGRIKEVHFTRWDKSSGVARGKVVIVACHGIETPRLLLNSASERHPKGIANNSDQVGRNLMDHPCKLSWALAKEPLYPFRGPLSTSGIHDFCDGPSRKDHGAYRIEIGNDGWAWPTGAPQSMAADLLAKGLRGKALDAAMRDQAMRQIRLTSLTEQLPDPANRMTLHATDKDMYGVPLPQIAYRVGDYVHDAFAAAEKSHDAILDHLGVTERHHSPDHFGAGHIMGTVRMGADAKTSVVDKDLRSHDHPNLFLLGSGTFPTGGTSNPTLTIAALTLRAVDAVKATLKAG